MITLVSHRIDVTVYNALQVKILKTTGSLRELSKAKVQTVYLKITVIAYQLQSIDFWMFLYILSDVSVPHPRGYDAKRKQRLRNTEEGQHIWM